MEKTYSYERKIELAVLFHYGRLEAVNKVLPVITAFFMYSASRIFKREQADTTDNNKSAYGKEKYGITTIASIIPPKAITTTIGTTGNMASTLSAVALFSEL